MNIQLTEKEEEICNILVNVCEYIENQQKDFENDKKIKKPTLRIAGGWVRDKLLGLESNDIDIAIDTMMGYDFAVKVREYMLEHNLSVSHMARVVANPEKNKNMETATGKVLGQSIDFVNLRSEASILSSMQPHSDNQPILIQYGTPSEDAFRRDITINALFFNINTRQVEDFTNMGISDLKSKIIRTPLPPYETFHDDPLRTLRVIRFASHFGFKINDDILESIKNKEIQDILSSKTSRSRIGEELNKMLNGHDPLRACEYIYDLNLYQIVFARPPENEVVTIRSAMTKAQFKELHDDMNKKGAKKKNKMKKDSSAAASFESLNSSDVDMMSSSSSLSTTNNQESDNLVSSTTNSSSSSLVSHMANTSLNNEISTSTNDDIDIYIGYKAVHALARLIESNIYSTFLPTQSIMEEKKNIRTLYLACLLLPYRNITFLERRREAIKIAPASVYMIRDALSFSREDIDTVSKLHSLINDTKEIIKKSYEKQKNSSLNEDLTREDYGLFLLKASVSPIKERWPLVIVLSFINEIYNKLELSFEDKEMSEIIEKYELFNKSVLRYNLETIHTFQPIINGKTACKLLNLKAGPIVGEVMKFVISWQLMNPNGTKEECEVWLKEDMKGWFIQFFFL